MMSYDARPLDLSFMEIPSESNSSKQEPQATAVALTKSSAVAPPVAPPVVAPVASSVGGHVNMNLLDPFQVSTSSSPISTAASTPFKQATGPVVFGSIANPNHAPPPPPHHQKIGMTRMSSSYSFDDRNQIHLPVVQMRTISNTKSKKRSNSIGAGPIPPKMNEKGENMGRWTTTEHELFLEGLTSYGKEWKKIAELIQTRSVVQIRTHAQKYFLKVAKARQIAQGIPTPASFQSTAISTCMMNQSLDATTTMATTTTTTMKKTRKRKSNGDMKLTSGINSTSSTEKKKKKTRKKLSGTKKLRGKKRSATFSSFGGGGSGTFNMDSEHLLKLDLFRSSQPTLWSSSATGSLSTSTSTSISTSAPSSTTTMSQQMMMKMVGAGSDGGASPTTAVTDLFASLETTSSSMIGLDFLDADIDGYDFDRYMEETGGLEDPTRSDVSTSSSSSELSPSNSTDSSEGDFAMSLSSGSKNKNKNTNKNTNRDRNRDRSITATTPPQQHLQQQKWTSVADNRTARYYGSTTEPIRLRQEASPVMSAQVGHTAIASMNKPLHDEHEKNILDDLLNM